MRNGGNYELRERLDEIVPLVRKLSRGRGEMLEEEPEEARQRLEWLGEEIRRSAGAWRRWQRA